MAKSFTKKPKTETVTEQPKAETPAAETTETKTVAVTEQSIGKTMLANAMAFANAKAEHVTAEVNRIVKGADDVATGTFRMVEAIGQDFGKEGDGIADLVTVVPRPHTKARPNDAGNFPAKYKVWEQKADGKWGDVDHDWYTDVVRNGPLGKPWVTRQEYLETLDNEKANIAGVPKELVEEFGGLDKWSQRGDAIQECTNKLGNLRRAYVRAGEFIHQWFAVESVPRICLDLNTDANGDVRNGAPIKVFEAKVKADGSIMTDDDGEPVPSGGKASVTLSTFNRYNAAKAIELGGGYEGLRKSLEREDGEEETNPLAGLTIKTPETFDKVFALLTARCEEMATAHDAEDQAALLKRYEKKGSDALVRAVYDMRAWCDDVLNANNKKLLNRAVRLIVQEKGGDTSGLPKEEAEAA